MISVLTFSLIAAAAIALQFLLGYEARKNHLAKRYETSIALNSVSITIGKVYIGFVIVYLIMLFTQ